jgi:hypothetical protein
MRGQRPHSTPGTQSLRFTFARVRSLVATGLSAGNLSRYRWITSVSRGFTGATAVAPNTPQDCRANGEMARPRRHSEWSVKPSAQPTLVRTQHLPPVTIGSTTRSARQLEILSRQDRRAERAVCKPLALAGATVHTPGFRLPADRPHRSVLHSLIPI